MGGYVLGDTSFKRAKLLTSLGGIDALDERVCPYTGVDTGFGETHDAVPEWVVFCASIFQNEMMGANLCYLTVLYARPVESAYCEHLQSPTWE